MNVKEESVTLQIKYPVQTICGLLQKQKKCIIAVDTVRQEKVVNKPSLTNKKQRKC